MTLSYKDLTDVKCCHIEYEIFGSDKTQSLMVTEWWNGEGVDIVLGDEEQRIVLHEDDLNAIVSACHAIGFIDIETIKKNSKDIKESRDRRIKAIQEIQQSVENIKHEF
jgi:hypothetical protein